MGIEELWYTRCPAPTAASIAIRQGWLAEEFAADGIMVRSLASAKDPAVHQSHYNHSQANSFRFGGYVPPLVTASRGADVKIIGMSWSDRAAAILTLPNSPINRPEDLRGKRWSLPRRTSDSIDWWRALVLAGYRHALHLAGLTFDDIELVEINVDRAYMEDASQGKDAGKSLWGARSQFAVQREEISALLRDEVDVIYSDAAMGELVGAFLGLKPVLDLAAPEDGGDVVHGHPLLLTVSGTLLQERPDLVSRWVSRLLEAQHWASDNMDAARRIIANDTGLPEEFVTKAYSPRIFEQLDVSLTPERLALLKAKHDQLLESGFLDRAVNLAALVDHTPLRLATSGRASA